MTRLSEEMTLTEAQKKAVSDADEILQHNHGNVDNWLDTRHSMAEVDERALQAGAELAFLDGEWLPHDKSASWEYSGCCGSYCSDWCFFGSGADLCGETLVVGEVQNKTVHVAEHDFTAKRPRVLVHKAGWYTENTFSPMSVKEETNLNPLRIEGGAFGAGSRWCCCFTYEYTNRQVFEATYETGTEAEPGVLKMKLMQKPHSEKYDISYWRRKDGVNVVPGNQDSAIAAELLSGDAEPHVPHERGCC